MVHISYRFLSNIAPKWEIMASVILARPPVIAPPMTDVEKRFHKLQLEEESEKSLLCDYELKTKQDQKILERREQLIREGKELSELEEEIGVTNLVREDEWAKKAEELKKKIDEKTQNGENTNQLSKLLDRKLVLIVKQKFGNDKYSSPWIFPQLKNKEGETLRQTAERCIGEITADDTLSANISGNAPFSVYTHRYPKPIAEKTKAKGAKIFFYQAVLEQNTKEFKANQEDVSDHRWITKEEFLKIVPGAQYRKAAKLAFLE